MYNDYLTLEQAEQRLTSVRPLLETARLIKREIEMIAATNGFNPTLIDEEKPRINSLVSRLSDTLDELEDLGCYIKDLDAGIVDFLSLFEGRDIFLCWRMGEATIKHWHEIDETYAQRQEILDLAVLDPTWEFETPIVENEN